MTTLGLDNKLVLVTGGGSGIGKGICSVLEREGCRVVVGDINIDGAKATVNGFKEPSKHLAVKMDISIVASSKECFEAIKAKYSSPPSLLVNNAGNFRFAMFYDTTEEQYDALMNTHVKGTFFVSQTFFNEYRKANLTEGSIVNIGSIAGEGGMKTMSVYCACKAAINILSRSMSFEAAEDSVRVNCIRPGSTNTPALRGVDPDILANANKKIPMSRIGEPEEIGNVAAFLLSTKSSYMTGATVDVSGGMAHG